MVRMLIVMATAAGFLQLAVLPATALTRSAASQICVKAAAKAHSDLLGNVQVRRVVKHRSGYEVNLQVKGVEVNCMLTGSGKVRYMN